MQKLDERLMVTIKQQDWLDRTGTAVQDFVKELTTGSELGRRAKDFLHGTWLAHPVHAVTTDVAIGAWTTAEVMDVAESVVGYKHWGAPTMAVGVGLAGAVASAASGLVDWSETYGEQKRVGFVHAMVNVASVLFYAGSLGTRIAGNRTAGKLLSAAGFSTILVGSYLGGDLAYRLGTQVDRNAWTKALDEFTPTMRESELQMSKPTRAEAKGIKIVLVRTPTAIHALSDTCAHEGCSLSKGHIEGENIVCGCHGSTYRIEDGTVVHGPAVYSQPSFETRVVDGQIEVRSHAEQPI